MAQQESSVRVSIEELLREAHAREEQERRDAEERARRAEQQRVDELQRRRELEEARLRTEDAERRRRAFDEEKRGVELRALHEGTVARAVIEAETRARLAEIAARHEHERGLHALRHDRHKKRLARVAIALTALAVAGGIGAGIAIKRSTDDAMTADARLRSVRDERDRLEQEQARLKQAIGNASDPEEIVRLQQQLADAQRQLRSVAVPTARPSAVHAPSTVITTPPARSPSAVKGPDTCPKGDPLCATIP
jgi:hypothetical protein